MSTATATTQTQQTQAETEIRQLIDNWTQAFLAKDLDGIMAHYAPDVVAFDAIIALQFKGIEAYREHWAQCLTFCQGAMKFELHELDITAGEDVAFSHSLSHCGGTNEEGEEQACWMRGTVCYRKLDGQWLVTHEHFSAPFDMESGKALFDLAP
ncbi:conserved hypothetical protein [Modicisalibacter muralis]|uniref:SnoaL-like domain-containing protein n=1 Tax=Modicisalibacter muralis TaxID=119000 RepID=A0A1G9S2I7_9GAMM|nr:SgcJ/EcaC family oxidoreductase [Halomonas muralis]SDM29681.1 conserved hypothetical protein [Halomonas muralis]